MADAKITLTTEAKNDGLEQLNRALAEGQQSVAQMQKELNDLTKATKSGTQATKEQAEAMVALRKSINEQKAANKGYASEIGKTTNAIKKSVTAMADGDKGARALAGAFKMTEGFTTAFSVAIGSLAANLATAAVSAMAEFASQVVTLGAQMQQSVAHMSAMVGGTQQATEAYRALNDAYRNTNFDEAAVMEMGNQLMRMGYSAQDAAGLISLCADAAAGLGTGQQGAQQLVDAISRMQAVGELTSKQMMQLEMSGVKMDEAFASLGMTGEQAMEAVKNGTLDTQQAIGALTDYLHQYDGKMAESKNNVIDAWSDVTGNLQTMCAEIGNDIFAAFNQSEIIQKLIDFTQFLVDMVRSDATGAFTDLKEIAGEVLDFIGGLLGFVLDTIKLIIVILHDAYAAFKSFGQQVVDAIRPAVDMVLALYDAVKAVMSSVGKAFGSEVAKSASATFGKNIDPEERVKAVGYITPAAARRSGGRGGGGRSGGGGGAAAALSEEAKAVEALIKKYADASKQKWKLAKTTIDIAKTNLALLTGENKVIEERRIKLQALEDSHNQLLEGLNKELELAAKIQDASIRTNTIKTINEQIAAENKLYEAKKRRIEVDSEKAGREYQAKSFADEMQHIKNLMDMHSISSQQRLAMENQVLEARRQQLQTLYNDEKINAEERAKIEQQLAETIKQINANAAFDVKSGWQQALQELANQQVNFKDAFVGMFNSIEGSLVSLVSGTESAKDKFKKFCQDITQTILKSMAQIIVKGLITRAIMAAIGMAGDNGSAKVTVPGGSGKSVVNIPRVPIKGIAVGATGGLVSGPGTGTSDSVPAMLSNGEYVIRSAAVDRIGIATLNRLNKVGHFADGGYVGSGGGWGAPPVVINLHNESGIPMDAEQTESQFDGESYVIGVVLNAVATNKMGMGSLLKGAARA